MAKAEKQPTPEEQAVLLGAEIQVDPEALAEITAQARNVYQRLVEVMAAVGYIQKRGKNAFHKYTYVQATDVAERAREAFVANGLLLLPSVETADSRERQSSDGKLSTFTRVRVQYQVINADNPEDRITFHMVGEGADTGDKSPAKALTASYKYALMELLMVSTGDDPEADPRVDQHPPIVPPISADQVVILESLIDTHGANLEKMLNFFSVTKLTEMTAAQFERACVLIEKRK